MQGVGGISGPEDHERKSIKFQNLLSFCEGSLVASVFFALSILLSLPPVRFRAATRFNVLGHNQLVRSHIGLITAILLGHDNPIWSQ